ncbi:3-phosphoshikimate 1-carboxyvinyltransferase [Allomyces macrogynus ATCC 38327]|uniref:Pentafunctional AROM polypeptide n=1 Tax=Allomyces macrogynus (strain ATCC 38327) TaxID=578462 RepID=A0A0L0SHK3_ALLM3|nr:3-phosphoshikimate 1-carboxyvinyltransferase [Allomyces macrogynus ATCC 38327]|eukprot:KNE61973.1 3-phosphoshikimate 1-carboxyvinyltransferase [Allomyces macrogynus ATCC 38327]
MTATTLPATSRHPSNPDVTLVPILGSPNTIQVGNSLTDHIAADLFSAIGATASKIAVVTDTNLAALGHLDRLVAALRNAWHAATTKRAAAIATDAQWLLTYIIPPGESVKTRGTKAAIEDWLLFARMYARHGCDRGSVEALSATWSVLCRLLTCAARVVQIPTTLLSMVDSSIGGKTAVDVPAGKNLVGAFHQPLRVYIDTAYLATLPKREIVNGMAEIIKTAAFYSADDFALLEADPDRVLAAAQAAKADPLLMQIVVGGARIKASVVSQDEKEGGLRGLLNFGHTVGHAIEAALTPRLLHGECVAMGMVYEAEIARYLGHLPQAHVGRLIRCIASYGLPTTLHDKLTIQYAGGVQAAHVAVDTMMEYMKVDKKNAGAQKKLVLLKRIGATVELRASAVDDHVIRLVIAPGVRVLPSPSIALPATKIDALQPVVRPTMNDADRGTVVTVPGSKSISNRALVLAALGRGTVHIKNLLLSDDTQVMLTALQRLGACEYTWRDEDNVLIVTGNAGKMAAPNGELYLGNAGTAARFLTAVTTLVAAPKDASEQTVLTGNARMKQRPIGPLVDALRENGVQVDYVEGEGCLPLRVGAGGLPGGHIKLAASVSSQYVSAILLCAPYARLQITLELTGGKVISQPYIDMTIAMMASFGIHVQRTAPTVYVIPQGAYTNPAEYAVEPDASSATYPLAVAAITGHRVTIPYIGSASLQGDARFAADVLQPMGCAVRQTPTETTVQGPAPGTLSALAEIDMEPMTDAFLTAAVLAAVATRQGGVTAIRGVANQRVKECNRIQAMMVQLAKFGVKTEELDDGIKVSGTDVVTMRSRAAAAMAAREPVAVDCYDDHRVAMAHSVLGALVPCVIKERKCVEKTWPAWWDTLTRVLNVPTEAEDIELEHDSEGDQAATSVAPPSVILIGMRAAGKTSLGQAAAKALGRTFIDLDHEFMRQRNLLSINQFVDQYGWPAFRAAEADLLESVAMKYPTGAVIACGGGIVETEKAREYLATGTSPLVVIHVVRGRAQVLAELAQSDRPSWGESMDDAMTRRLPLYRKCTATEFFVADVQGKYDWAAIEAQFAEFVAQVTGMTAAARKRVALDLALGHTRKAAATASPVTSFVSLTQATPEQLLANLDRITEGTDAVELRADLLKDRSVEGAARAYFTLKRHLPADVPVIFTVRSAEQAGTFPDDQIDAMVDLLRAAIAWGVDILDLEVTTFPAATLRDLAGAAARRGIPVLTSYHDKAGAYKWDRDRVHWAQMLQQCAAHGDICKLVSRAHVPQDNMALVAFRVNDAAALTDKPLIAINMGAAGQLSRVLNHTLTPITHTKLPAAAAPGQMALDAIHRALVTTGELAPREFYLFGSPIAASKSPAMHNTGFATLGLTNHTYYPYEATDVNLLRKIIERESFGGASVTIPLKEQVHQLVADVTPTAKAIGAINTLFRRASDGALVGDNTDVIGIRDTLAARLKNATVTNLHEGGLVALVLGAGGTARAAVAALLTLPTRIPITSIVVANRTVARAQALLDDFASFGSANVQRIAVAQDPATLEAVQPHVVVGTIPRDAQDATLFARERAWARTVAVVEMVYGAPTPLVLALPKGCAVVSGAEVLVEQGLAQFERWTGLRAPRAVIEEAVAAAFARE